MEVEVDGEDGSKFVLGLGKRSKTLFGRGSGFNTNDRTVSRRHVSFELRSSPEKSGAGAEPRVSFEVIGRNPIWVISKNDEAIRVFRKFEKGELGVGDRFCLSGKAPLWFVLKDSEVQEGKTRALECEKEVSESARNGLDIEDIDISGIDPVEEFGFVVMGHEFDHYPKGMIRNVKNWDWFLEEPSKDSEDDNDIEEKRTTTSKKRKKVKDNGDDDWTVESEDDKDLAASIRKVKRSGYSTRSKDQNRRNKDTKVSKSSGRKKVPGVDETVEDEEDDETLGSFIVDDEEEDQDDENSEEEEEEFEEDDDEMEG